MAFSDFKYPQVLHDLGLTLAPTQDLFGAVPPVAPGPPVLGALPVGVRLGGGADSEFSRAVWMVGPVLADVWSRYDGSVCLIGGADFEADRPAGLSGVCDFVVSRAPHQSEVFAPAVVIMEAKRGSIPNGLGQCIAGMVGADRFNRREGRPIESIYGCVTTGSLWRFLRLTGTTVTLDQTDYTITQVENLIGIFLYLIGPPPAPAAAA